MSTKRCYVCKIEKPLADFGKKATNKDGLQRICKACQKIERKRYYDANKEKEFEHHRLYELSHKKEINAQRAITRANNPEYYPRVQQYVNKRKVENIEFLILTRSRCRIARALKLQQAKAYCQLPKLLGCDMPSLKAYLESSFTEGMSWELYLQAEIHIDHIIPCACFDLFRPDHQRACFHYSNLRMLWKKENLGRKASLKTTPEQIEEYVKRFTA